MNKKLSFLGLILSIIVLSGCANNSADQGALNTPVDNKPVVEKPAETYINVPNLINRNIDEIVITLKQYIKNDSEPKAGEEITDPRDKKVKLWTKTFQKDDQNLTILYNLETKKVVNFFIASTKKEADKDYVLKISEVKSDNAKYTWSMINKPDKTFSGILVVPK